MGYWLISELLRTIDVMPYLTFKFATYATIACHATFFTIKLPCCPPPVPTLFFLIWKKRKDNSVKLKSDMDCKSYFKMTFFKSNCP